MPLFMDRHDVSEDVTAENVAQLHQEDLKIQEEFGCRGLTYWFDDKRKTAFCLIEADDRSAIVKMHKRAHGEVPNQIIEVDPKTVESFLGRIEDPANAENSELTIIDDSALRIIMLIKLELLNQKYTDPAKGKYWSDKYRSAVLDLLEACQGKLIKQGENDFLASFKFASDAVQAALKIRVSLFEKFSEFHKMNLSLKIGLSSGVPVTEKSTIFEEAIKLAERICRVIKEEIILSADVDELFTSETLVKLKAEKQTCILTKKQETFLNLLMDFAERNLNNSEVKVEDLNRSMMCSKSKLYREMILLTGKSPNNFLSDFRLDQAHQLITNSIKNISEVAYETGFTSPSYFTKCFQKKFGFAPSKCTSDNR